MKNIPLTKGQVALVDDEDFDFLMQWKWCATENGKTKGKYYAQRNAGKSTGLMHRVIMGVSERNVFVDHLDGNGLNNQKQNLRVCSVGQNNLNRRAYKTNKSGFKGVSWVKDKGRWVAQIQINRKKICLGFFDDVLEAARHYNKGAKELHGEFATINDVEPPFPTKERPILRSTNTSGFRGVSREQRWGRRWVANITINKKTTTLGYFSNPEEAASAYDKAAKRLYGEGAKLNFPNK